MQVILMRDINASYF